MKHQTIVVCTLHVAGRRVDVSKHAAIRYRDRVRPGLSVRDAIGEMQKITVSCGRLVLGQPWWIMEPETPALEERAQLWLMLGEDVALPVVDDVAVTCLAKGAPSEASLARRAENRARRAAAAMTAPAVVFLVIREYVRMGEVREKVLGVAASEEGAQAIIDSYISMPADGATRSLDWVRFEVQP